MSRKSERELVVRQFIQREEEIHHPGYDTELDFYEGVSDGRITDVYMELNDGYGEVDSPVRGVLSTNKIRNLRYHIIVTIAMISRFCIEKGMEQIESYALSDYYIRQLDETDTEAGLRSLHRECVIDYSTRMRNLRRGHVDSIHCIKAMDFVQNHLHENISLASAAKAVGLEKTYFCRLFTRSVGMGFPHYVMQEKIKVACRMLEHSEYNCTEIAEFLAFSTGAYFGRIFKEFMGMTPMQYRRRSYGKHWSR